MSCFLPLSSISKVALAYIVTGTVVYMRKDLIAQSEILYDDECFNLFILSNQLLLFGQAILLRLGKVQNMWVFKSSMNLQFHVFGRGTKKPYVLYMNKKWKGEKEGRAHGWERQI
jgi:hypothetical protein